MAFSFRIDRKSAVLSLKLLLISLLIASCDFGHSHEHPTDGDSPQQIQ